MAKTLVQVVEDIKDAQLSLKSAGYYNGIVDGDYGSDSRKALAQALNDAYKGRAPVVQAGATVMSRTLDDAQIREVSNSFGVPFSATKAVIAVESGGGWFTDVRKDILDLDGPGGFLDGALLKILHEAKWFHKFTNGAFDKMYPNISSPIWDRKLYVGGVGEYKRFWTAHSLDVQAAYKSSSWGMFQIMGFNFGPAGFTSAEDMVAAMKTGEMAQLKIFFQFISTVKHNGKTLLVWLKEKNFPMFAEGYNGEGYAANHYGTKLYNEDKKYA